MKKDLLKKVLVLLPALAMVACASNGADDGADDPWGEDGDVDIELPTPSGTSTESGNNQPGGNATPTPDQGGGDEGGDEGGNEGGNPDQGGGNEGGGTEGGGTEGGGTEGGGSEGGETTEHITYITLGKDGRYNGETGTSIKVNEQTTLEYAFKLTLAAGETLPGADKITSVVENTTFKHFYAGDDENTAVTTVPTISGTVLTAKWETTTPPVVNPTYSISGTGFEAFNLTSTDLDPEDPNMKAQYTGSAALEVGDTFQVKKSDVETFTWNLSNDNIASKDFTFANNTATVKRADTYTFYFKLYEDGNELYLKPANPPKPVEATYSIESENFEKLSLTATTVSEDEPTMKAQYTGTIDLTKGNTFKFVKSDDPNYAVNLDPETVATKNFTLDNGVFTVNRTSNYTFYFKLYDNGNGNIGNKLTIKDNNPDKFAFNIEREGQNIATALVNDTNEGEYKSEGRIELKAGDKITATLGRETLKTLKSDVNNFGKFTVAENHILVNEIGAGKYFVKISADGINIFRGEPSEGDTYRVVINPNTDNKVVAMAVNGDKKNEYKATVELKENDEVQVWCGTDAIISTTAEGNDYNSIFENINYALKVKPGQGGTYEICAQTSGANVWYTYKVVLPEVEKDLIQIVSKDGQTTEIDIPNLNNEKHEYAYKVKFDETTKIRVLFKDGFKTSLEGLKGNFNLDRDGFITAKEGHYGYYTFYIKTTGNDNAGQIFTEGAKFAEVIYNNEIISAKETVYNKEGEDKILLDLPQNAIVRFYNGDKICNNVIFENNIFEKDDANNVAKLVKENGAVIEFYYGYNAGKIYTVVKGDHTLYKINYNVTGGEGDIPFKEIPSGEYEMIYQYSATFTLTGPKTLKINANGNAITLAKIDGKVNSTNSDNFTLGAGTYTIYLKAFATGYDIYIA